MTAVERAALPSGQLPTRRIDARLVHPLIDLPGFVVGETEIPEHHSLAVRDLLRGHALDLPSGEAVARAMGLVPRRRDGSTVARLCLSQHP